MSTAIVWYPIFVDRTNLRGGVSNFARYLISRGIVHLFNSDGGKFNLKFWCKNMDFQRIIQYSIKNMTLLLILCYSKQFCRSRIFKDQSGTKKWTFGTKKTVKIRVNVRTLRFSKSRRLYKKMDFGFLNTIAPLDQRNEFQKGLPTQKRGFKSL